MPKERSYTVTEASSRTSLNWQQNQYTWLEFCIKLSIPSISKETVAEFFALSKAEQDELKDVGGFVGGELKGTRRTKKNLVSRSLITLDLDNITGEEEAKCIEENFQALQVAFLIYPTRKHTKEHPRFRAVLPLDRDVSAQEYESITREIAKQIGFSFFDPTTFEPSRLMYYPSCCRDFEYFVIESTSQNVLQASKWLNPSADIAKRAEVQGDPREKTGVIGAFCRAFDVVQAIHSFLPEQYEEVENASHYTYTLGSSTGGAVLYDGNQFLFSHHATDPACGTLCNAFDLVRLHKFGYLDEGISSLNDTKNMPSQKAMLDFAQSLPEVQAELMVQREEELTRDFADINVAEVEKPLCLDLNEAGFPKRTANNALKLVSEEARLKGRIAYNAFARQRVVRCPVPWDKSKEVRRWADEDDAGLRWFLETYYQFDARAKVDDAVALTCQINAYNEVHDYITNLSWDGITRLDSLFIAFLGAQDSPYTRAVTKKAFTAGVARIMQPAIKFDYMTILTGAQGIGKSTILRKMGKDWFSDSIRTFDGKESVEALQGVWIIEIAELDAMNKSETERVKHFLSQQNDKYRKAYGKHSEDYPRQCIFFGTSNKGDFLRDTTGNRRFLPIDCGVEPVTQNVFKDLTKEVVDQLWAEAKYYYEQKEPLYLSGELEQEARNEQEAHRESSVKEGVIKEFVARKVPFNWNEYSLERRLGFWDGLEQEDAELVERDRVCALEVWCECFRGDSKLLKRMDAREINDILSALPQWVKSKSVMRFGDIYGTQKGFRREQM